MKIYRTYEEAEDKASRTVSLLDTTYQYACKMELDYINKKLEQMARDFLDCKFFLEVATQRAERMARRDGASRKQ